MLTNPKQVNFRPTVLDDLILERLADADLPGVKNKSDLIRFCVRLAGEQLIDEQDFNDILLHAARLN